MISVFRRLSIIGVAYVRMDGVILECNTEFAKIMGDDITHLIGKNVIQITSPEDKERAVKNLRALETGEAQDIHHDKRYTNRSGEIINCRCQFIRTKNGNKDEYFITSFVYRHNPFDSNAKRVAMLEARISDLLKILSKSHGLPEVNINMTNDHSSKSEINAIADNGAQVTQTASQGSNQTFLIVAVVAIALSVLGLGAFIFGGSMSASGGGAEVEIDAPGEGNKKPQIAL